MTEQIDRDDLRNDIESILGDPASSPTPRYWAQAADKLLDALDRAEAQSAIRGRAVVIYRDRARKAEAERDWNIRSSRLAKEERIKANARAESAEARIRDLTQEVRDERGAALDLLEQIKVRDRRIQAVQHLVDQADHAGNWTVTCTHLQRAIDG